MAYFSGFEASKPQFPGLYSGFLGPLYVFLLPVSPRCRSDTDSAFQTDESNFSSLRNSLDQAPLSNVATPVLTDSDAPVTPTTLTSTQSAFPFTLDADDATTLKEESGGIGTKKSSDFATPQTVVGGEDPSGCDQGELKSLDVKHECSPDLQSSESDAERSKFVSPSAKKTGITGVDPFRRRLRLCSPKRRRYPSGYNQLRL